MTDSVHLERVLRDNRINPDKLRNALVIAAEKYREVASLLPVDHASLAEEFTRYAEEVDSWCEILDGEQD